MVTTGTETETLLQLQQRVLHLVRNEVLQTPPDFGITSDLFEAGLDSMAIMQMLLLLEENFGIAIPVGSVSRANFKNAVAIAALLKAQGYPVADSPEEETTQAPTPTEKTPAAEVSARSTFQTEPSNTEPTRPISSAETAPPMQQLSLRNTDHFVYAFDLMLRDAGQVGHIARSILELDTLPDVAAIKQLIADLPQKFPFPILTAQLRKPSFFSLPVWVPAKSPRPIELGLWSQAGSAGLLLPHGGQAFTDLDGQMELIVNWQLPHEQDNWANVRFDLVEKADGSFLFVFSWSHLIMDGVGAEHFLVEMNRLLGGRHETVPPFDISDEKDTRGWKERWESSKVMPEIFDKVMEIPFAALGSRSLGEGRTHYKTITLTPEQTQEVARRSAEVSGPLINMPFHLACAMRAHDRVLAHRGQKAQSLMCSVPIQARKKGARGPIFQNHLSMFFCSLPADKLKSLSVAAQELQNQHARFLKDKLADAFRDLMWIMRYIPPRIHMKFVRWKMGGTFSSLYHSNTGTFAPELTEFAGAKIINAYHVPGFSNPPGSGVFTSEKNGRLTLTLCWRTGVLTEEEQQIFIDQLMEDMVR